MYCQLVVAVVVAAVFAVLAVVVAAVFAVLAVVVMIGAVVDAVVDVVVVIAAVVFSCFGEQDFKSIMNRFFGLYGRLKLKL